MFKIVKISIFFKEINTFIQQGHIKLIQSDSKSIYSVIKDLVLIKCCSFELSIQQWWAENLHIWMISEESCDTEDCGNNAENSVLHHRNKLHFKIYLKEKQSL